jgi:lipid-A-disaccharide synthase-like uncharacterized protein
MQVLRILLVTAIAGGLLWLLIGTLLQGFRTGKMHYMDSESVCDQRSNPVLFWFLTLVFASLSVMIATVWWKSLFH